MTATFWGPDFDALQQIDPEIAAVVTGAWVVGVESSSLPHAARTSERAATPANASCERLRTACR